jgi:hypothetical protein
MLTGRIRATPQLDVFEIELPLSFASNDRVCLDMLVSGTSVRKEPRLKPKVRPPDLDAFSVGNYPSGTI